MGSSRKHRNLASGRAGANSNRTDSRGDGVAGARDGALRDPAGATGARRLEPRRSSQLSQMSFSVYRFSSGSTSLKSCASGQIGDGFRLRMPMARTSPWMPAMIMPCLASPVPTTQFRNVSVPTRFPSRPGATHEALVATRRSRSTRPRSRYRPLGPCRAPSPASMTSAATPHRQSFGHLPRRRPVLRHLPGDRPGARPRPR